MNSTQILILSQEAFQSYVDELKQTGNTLLLPEETDFNVGFLAGFASGFSYKGFPNHNMENNAPPLGLVPEWLRKEQRFHELMQAVNRYLQKKTPIPPEWIVEYNDLSKWLKNFYKKFKNAKQ